MSDKTAIATKQKSLFDQLSEESEDYQHYLDRLSDRRKIRIKRSVANMQYGLHAAAPLTCLGPEKCIFFHKCPIPDRDPTTGEIVRGPTSDYPIGESCVLENYYMRQKMMDYAKHLDVDIDNPVEMSIVNELALIDLYKNRAVMVLGAGDRDGQGRDFMRTDTSGYGHDANGGSRIDMKLQKSDVHPAARYIDQLERRREKWLEKLVETRKTKAELDLKAGKVKDDSKMLNMIHTIAEHLTNMQSEPLELTVDDDGSIDFDD